MAAANRSRRSQVDGVGRASSPAKVAHCPRTGCGGLPSFEETARPSVFYYRKMADVGGLLLLQTLGEAPNSPMNQRVNELGCAYPSIAATRVNENGTI